MVMHDEAREGRNDSQPDGEDHLNDGKERSEGAAQQSSSQTIDDR